MGSFISSAMDDNMKKQQEFMVANQVVMLERNMAMQNAMREKMMATQISRMRELLNWTGSFYALTCAGLIAGAVKNHNPLLISPLIPLGFGVGYQYDMAYNGKMKRITAGAEDILNGEKDLLNIALGMPTVADLDRSRAEGRKN